VSTLPHALSRVTSVVLHLRHLEFLDHVYAPPSVVLAALGAAACFAVAAVLQQSAASSQDHDLSLRPQLLLNLLHQRRWVIGNLASVGGYVLQFLALERGSLALVEPLLVASLVIALPFGAALEHRRLRSSEWAPALMIVAALAWFLLAAQPGPGEPRASSLDWIVLGVVTASVVGLCVRYASAPGRRRALLLATAAGLLFGLTGALTEVTGHTLTTRGFGHVLTSGAPYALIVVSVVGFLLNQSAFQAGALRWSLPVMTILEPLVAIMIGEFMFGEHIDTSLASRLGEIIGLVMMTAGIVILSRNTQQEPEAAVTTMAAAPEIPRTTPGDAGAASPPVPS
jgi:drug/metabolite transporter (DMT)-like permease